MKRAELFVAAMIVAVLAAGAAASGRACPALQCPNGVHENHDQSHADGRRAVSAYSGPS